MKESWRLILSCISLLKYASLLVIVTWLFHIRRFFPFLGIVMWHFHIWNPFPFFGRLVQKVVYLVFHIDLFRKRRNSQMTAVILQVSPSFYENYSKNSLFNSANTYEKFIVCKEYCSAHYDNKICFPLNCRYYIILIGNIKDFLQKLFAFCFNYQHVDCLYTLFKYRFNGKTVIKSGKLFDDLRRAVHFNQQNRGV